MMWFKGARILYWVGYTVGFSILYTLSIAVAIPDPYSMSYVKDEMEENYGTPIEDVACILMLVYEPQTNLTTWKVQGLVSTFSFSSIMCCHYAMMIYCSIQIRAKMKELISMTSSKTHRLQSQLFLTLIFQIVSPSIFHHIPAFALYHAPFLNLKLRFPSGVMVALFSVYPAVDSWILMSVVTEYKRAIRQMMNQLLVRKARTIQSSSTALPIEEIEIKPIRPPITR